MTGVLGAHEVSSPHANEVETTLACLCATVETTAHSSPDEMATLLDVYATKRWSDPLERDFDTTEQWSLQRDRQAHRPRAPRCDPASEIRDLERLVASTTSERHIRTLTAQLRRVRDTAADTRNTCAPRQLQLPRRTEEVDAEMRWSALGRPQPLRRNILGERYATPDRPLAFLARHGDATALFRVMRPRVKLELKRREARRIERLNAHRKPLSDSPEDALEAKLDRLLLSQDNNAGL